MSTQCVKKRKGNNMRKTVQVDAVTNSIKYEVYKFYDAKVYTAAAAAADDDDDDDDPEEYKIIR